MRSRPCSRSGGFSLIELLVGTCCVAVMALAFHATTTSAASAMHENSDRHAASVRARRWSDAAAAALRSACLSTLETTPPGFATPQPLDDAVPFDDLRFDALAFDPGAPQDLPEPVGPYVLATIESPTDTANGVDDDADGTADELQLVLQRPDGSTTVLATEVTAFSVVKDGRTLRLSVQSAHRVAGGAVVIESSFADVEIRND